MNVVFTYGDNQFFVYGVDAGPDDDYEIHGYEEVYISKDGLGSMVPIDTLFFDTFFDNLPGFEDAFREAVVKEMYQRD